MGLFGGKKTYVASTVYNMAGPELNRINFLKTVVVGGTIGTTNYSTSDTINNVYIPGPGIKARAFFRWAVINYGGIGVPAGNLGGTFSLNAAQVEPFLPVAAGQVPLIQSLQVGPADYSYWAEQWVLVNYPDRMNLAWVADLIGVQIKITWPDLTTSIFTPVGMTTGTYVYVVYTPKNTDGTFGNSIYWFYRKYTGNAALDAAIDLSHTPAEWIPAIPFRIENKFLSPNYLPAAYQLAKKAYRKASGRKKYEVMIDKIANNPSLADIDHAFMTYGVCLNVKERACKEYLFRLFSKLASIQEYTAGDATAYNNAVTGYRVNPVTSVPLQPQNSVRIRSTGSMLPVNLDYEIRWSFIKKVAGAGFARPGVHKRNDYWIEKGGAPVTESLGTVRAGANVLAIFGTGGEKITLFHQVNNNYWNAIEITGLRHINHVYLDKSVEITSYEALDDPDDTGFIVPLHYPTIKEMSLVKSTQMMTAATFMVFNSYKVVKQKWYQTIAFKIFIFIVIVAITVLTMGTGTAPAVGILGSAAAVGAAVGLSGVIGIIVGTIINALVAMIIAKLIGMVSVELFGAKWGAIIGTIVSMVVLAGATGFANGQSLAQTWGAMMNPINIINMTSSVGSGIAGYMQASAMGWNVKTLEAQKTYDQQQKEVTDKIAEMYGGSRGVIDPLGFTSISLPNFFETEDSFLSRTLMTGTDIANMTQDMLNNFTTYTTALPYSN